MKSILKLAIPVLVIAVFISSIAVAQTTLEKQIPIKGKLTTTTGTPLEGKYNFVFEIFDAATEGNSLWSETKQISVTKGIWSTNLGSTTPLPFTIATEKQLYIEITANSKKYSPRSPIYTGLTSRDLTLPNSIGTAEIKTDYGILSKITGSLFTLVNNVFNFAGSLTSSGTVTASKLVGNASSGNAIEAYGTVSIKSSPTAQTGTLNIGSGSIAYTANAWTITPGLSTANIQDNSITRSKVSSSFIQAGSATVLSAGSLDIPFPTAFGGTPNIVCTTQTTNSYCVVKNPSSGTLSTGFKANVYIDSGSGATYPSGGIVINWIAVGA
ncbi:MAG: hypothetical protein HY362_02325 [Candidatus Aenigmarchaeota archaeon]|nr:hypothetical protein [Candidatus Aenigmarchaeota archaeon]